MPRSWCRAMGPAQQRSSARWLPGAAAVILARSAALRGQPGRGIAVSPLPHRLGRDCRCRSHCSFATRRKQEKPDAAAANHSATTARPDATRPPGCRSAQIIHSRIALPTVSACRQRRHNGGYLRTGPGQHPSLNVIRSQDRRVACRLGVPQEVQAPGYRRQFLPFSSACLINGRVVTCSCWSRSAVLIWTDSVWLPAAKTTVWCWSTS